MNQPRLVLLLPITRDNLTSRYIDGIESLVSSPISKRVIIINKTENDLGGIISRFRKRDENLECSIVYRERNTGIFEGFMGISIQENEWIMQIHDDDEARGQIKTFNPRSRYCYFLPHRPKSVTSMIMGGNSNEWVFSAISSFFWNTLICYFDYIGQAPLPSSDYTMNTLINVLGVRKQFNDYSYKYSPTNWKPRAKQEHLRNILIQNGWGYFANSRIATLNMKIDALAFFAFVISLDHSQEINSKLRQSIETQEREILKSLSKFIRVGFKSNISQLTRISEKQSQSEVEYFECFSGVNSIEDLPTAISRLEHLDIPALKKRAKTWRTLIESMR